MNIELAMNMMKNPFQNTACKEYSEAKIFFNNYNDMNKKIVDVQDKIKALKAELAKLEGK